MTTQNTNGANTTSESENKPTKDFIIIDIQSWDAVKKHVFALKGLINTVDSIPEDEEAYESLLEVIAEIDTEWPQWQ